MTYINKSIKYYLKQNPTLLELYSDGIINLGNVEIKMKKDIEILKNKVKSIHPYSWGCYSGRWRTYVADYTAKTGRKLIYASSEIELLNKIIVHYSNDNLFTTIPSLEQIYPLWLRHKEITTVAETTIMKLKSDWKIYLADTPITKIPINKLTKINMEEWAYSLIRQYSMTKTNYYNVSTIIRQSLDYAVELNIIENNPLRKVIIKPKMFRTVIKDTGTSQVYTSSELKQVKEFALYDFDNSVKKYELSPLALLFMFQTGLRISEVCCVKFNDIQSDGILIQRMLRRDTHKVIEHTKGSYGVRKIILTSQANDIIALAKERQIERNGYATGYIFSLDNDPCSYRAIEHLFTKYCQKLNIPVKSSHKARKTVISEMLDAGVNINTVRAMAGHTDERTTYKNYCYDRTEENEKIIKIQDALRI